MGQRRGGLVTAAAAAATIFPTMAERAWYVGIDVHGARPHIVAVLDQNLSPEAIISAPGGLEFVQRVGDDATWVAVDAPRCWPSGVMDSEQFRCSLSPPPPPGRYRGWRVCEALLRMRYGIGCYVTPPSPRPLPKWMRAGMALFRALSERGFEIIDEHLARSGWRAARKLRRAVLECYPHATFALLAGGRLVPKSRPEGCEQRVRILRGMGVSGDLAGLPADALDAVAAALTAYLARAGRAEALGHPSDGFIIVPRPQTRSKAQGLRGH